MLFLALLIASASAKTVRFDMRDLGHRNLVQFVSDATLEKTVGISSSVSGWLELDPEKVDAGVKVELEVDVRTFHTGIEMRNEQIRDKFFNAAEFPIATFTVTKLLSTSRNKITDQTPATWRLEGTLRARGASRTIPILAKVVYLKENEVTRQRLGGNLLKVSASFDVDTAQFNVTIPDNLKARFSRYLQVSVDMIGSDRAPTP